MNKPWPLLSALDFALIKIHRLELEAERKEVRLCALRCRLTEVLNENPTVIRINNENIN